MTDLNGITLKGAAFYETEKVLQRIQKQKVLGCVTALVGHFKELAGSQAWLEQSEGLICWMRPVGGKEAGTMCGLDGSQYELQALAFAVNQVEISERF